MLGTTRFRIRSVISDSLLSIGSVGTRVVTGEAVPSLLLPNIVFNIEDEEIDPAISYMGNDIRKFDLVIQGRTLARDGSDSPLDDLCLDIEKAIAGASGLTGYCQDLILDSTTIELDEADIPVALATIRYRGCYDDTTETVPMWTVPTLVSWNCTSINLDSAGVRLAFNNCQTTGSPCQVQWKVVSGSNVYATKWTSPEQTSPHSANTDITAHTSRGKWYDLYWKWQSSSFSGDWELVRANAIYVPFGGEGDFTHSSEG